MSSISSNVTGSLEDYLETIYRIQGRNSVARVRDIAEEMDVSPASVSPAMKRLADLGLVGYSKRNYIRLTEKGLSIARRTLVRHHLLSRFLSEILGTDPGQAEEDACAMEHHLSESSMERLAAFFEFLAACPELQKLLEKGFGYCLEGVVEENSSRCSKSICPLMGNRSGIEVQELDSVDRIKPGSTRMIARISGGRETRRHLIDLGFIQGAEVTLERPGNKDLPCMLILDGYSIELPLETAGCILVHPEKQSGKDEG